MNPWLNESSLALNQHGGFGPQGDNTMAFLQPPTMNPQQFQNQPYLNGAGRTASPAFQNPMYQTNPVIPSKRTREDSLGGSPRQAPNAPPGSRSQTPGQGFQGFNPQQTNGSGQPFANGPTQFQHLQTATNATPSPTIQQQSFNQANNIPRVSTASPSPFSPQHGGPQMSPGPGDRNNRMTTPLDTSQNFASQGGFPPGFNGQQFAQNMVNGGQMGMGNINMAQQQMQPQGMNAAQRNYQMQMQAQARQLHAAAQARNAGNMPTNMQGMQNPQMPAMEQQNMPTQRPNNPEEFLRGLQSFMSSRGRTVDMNPTFCGRQVSLLKLCGMVLKNGGSGRFSKMNQWHYLAQHLGYPQPQLFQAGQEMQSYWMSNLAPYEAAMLNAQQRQRMAAQNQLQSPVTGIPNMGGQDVNAMMNQSNQRSQPDMMKMNGQMPNQPQANMNGSVTSTQQSDQGQGHRPSLSRQLEPQQLNGMSIGSPTKRPQSANIKTEADVDSKDPIRKPIEDPFKPDILPPSRYHGPINVDEMFILGAQILEVKPVQPQLRELGVIDIHALTMAIKSGMHAETRIALDTLISLSTESSLQLSLPDCEDLMETLADYAQSQADLLDQHSSEVSDEISLSSYEEVVRACKAESESLQDVPEFGTLSYDLDRAADRLICVTTLIRNFSFYEANFGVLGQSEVLKVITSVIQQLGTKEMPLRSYKNTLDFMKDVVIYLSNLSTSLNLPGKQEALCLLHFLLAFAPTPTPVSTNSGAVRFTMYNPNLHKYMPSAVDSLAKLLARDEPNRVWFKSIFNADAHSSPPYELLTRSFGLAIAAIPSTSANTRAIVEARKPFLLQGMLAAEIVASLAPGSENPLVRHWLESDDGFASSLLRLVSLLSSQASAPRQPPPQQHNMGRGMPPQIEHDSNAYGALTTRAMSVLKTLVQKSRVLDKNCNFSLPPNVSLKKETLLGAMVQKDLDPAILRQLCLYAGLED